MAYCRPEYLVELATQSLVGDVLGLDFQGVKLLFILAERESGPPDGGPSSVRRQRNWPLSYLR